MNTETNRGFTLIEVLVSVSIFAMVMLVATGAVFSIVEANKKTHSLKSVMTNLNFALESMARDIRVGTHYRCVGNPDNITSPQDCPIQGDDVFSFKANRDVGGINVYDDNDRIQYWLENGRIMREMAGGVERAITAGEIDIESMTFYVVGTTAGDKKQPKVVIMIKGNAGTGNTDSDFIIQTTVSQRSIDS